MLKELFCSKAQWPKFLGEEFDKPYMRELEGYLLEEERLKRIVYPPRDQIFEAFFQTPFKEVKVVLVGQDPYHGPGQAHGLAFSVPPRIPLPASLRNIFKELQADVGVPKPAHGSLLSWAKQGVFLLNATLTVRKGEAASHFGKGWETFTDKAIQLLIDRKDPLVFLFWGRFAYQKWERLGREGTGHLILTAAHPSPLSARRGFFGCRHFSQANAFLKKVRKAPIEWAI